MDIREAVAESFTWKQFISQMEKRGYEWKLNRKYIALRAPGMERYVRLKSLGKHYSENGIREWILQPKKQDWKNAEGQGQKRKLHGLQALYYSYLYQMGVLKKRPKYPSSITNVGAGHGLIRCSGNIVPFENTFPKNTKLYRLMTTKPGE